MRLTPKFKRSLATTSATAVIFMTNLLVTGYAFADSSGEYGEGSYHMHSGHMGWGYHGFIGPVIMIGLVVLIVIGIVMLINRSRDSNDSVSPGRQSLMNVTPKAKLTMTNMKSVNVV